MIKKILLSFPVLISLLSDGADCARSRNINDYSISLIKKRGEDIKAKYSDEMNGLKRVITRKINEIKKSIKVQDFETQKSEENRLYEAAKKDFMMYRCSNVSGAPAEICYDDENINRLNNKEEYKKLWFEYINKERLIEYLMFKGVDVNIVDNDGNTALHLLLQSGYHNRSHVELLLLNGANLEAKNHEGKTPIFYCKNSGIKDLISSYEENPRFLMIIRSGRLPLIKKYLDKNPGDINAKFNGRAFSNDSTPLHIASYNGYLSIVEYLISKGADINAKDDDGNTPLHTASSNGHLPIVEYLISKGADINAKTKDGYTPISLAFSEMFKYKRCVPIVRLLIDSGADINAFDNEGKTPIYWALGTNPVDRNRQLKIEFVKLFIEKGANVKGADIAGETPLHAVIDQYNYYDEDVKQHITKIAELLISKGANINAKDNRGMTPLHMASLHGYHSVAQLLIASVADINAQDIIGNTPLHYASKFGYESIVKLLIDKGAFVNITNSDRLMPADLALHQRIKELLKNGKRFDSSKAYQVSKADPKSNNNEPRKDASYSNKDKYYQALGLNKDEISKLKPDDQYRAVKKAHTKLAMQWHPDRNKGDETRANEKMKEINEAYAELTNRTTSSGLKD